MVVSSARQRVCVGYLARAEPEERHVGSMIRCPQARKRSYGSTREIGRVRLCGFLVRLGRHGNCWPTAAVRSHADVLPYECLHLVAAKQRIAHGTDEAMSSSPRFLGWASDSRWPPAPILGLVTAASMAAMTASVRGATWRGAPRFCFCGPFSVRRTPTCVAGDARPTSSKAPLTTQTQSARGDSLPFMQVKTGQIEKIWIGVYIQIEFTRENRLMKFLGISMSMILLRVHRVERYRLASF